MSVYGCTSGDDDSKGGAGEAGSAAKGGGAGASGHGSGGKASGGTSSGAAGGGEAGVSAEGGTGPVTGGSGGKSGKGGGAGKGGTAGETGGGAENQGGAGETGAGNGGEGNTGPLPFVCKPESPGSVAWSDGFETGGPDFSITGGVWAIGAPTAADGPAPFEGSNVAGTVLGGDYGASADAWLITPNIDIPAAKNHPRFGFRYWYELAAGDTVYVAVRVGTGSWQTLFSARESGDGDWRNVMIPMDGYADETVQFAFRLVTDSAAQAAGFYVDDMRLVTGDIGMGNCENFENGWGEWTSTGVWDVGAPTASDGPQPFEGTKLAGTLLSGDYGSSEDAWLITPEIAVPAAKEEPRFSFKYWYELAGGDAVYTAYRLNHGSWQTVMTNRGSGDGAWRNLTLPLNAFADQTVELAFRLVTDTAAFAPGFYIDDVRYETGPLAVTTAQGFENGWDGWSAYSGVWAVGKPTASDGPSPHGGKNVAGTILSGDYGSSEDAWLISPRVFVPQAATHSKLSYWYWYDLAAGDKTYVAIRSDGGSWQTIDSLSSAADNTWRQHVLDLSTYADHTIELGFRLVTDSSASAPGFYLDDVTFTLE